MYRNCCVVLWTALLLGDVTVKGAQPTPYTASKHGGSYMFNYYLPPAPSTTPWAPCWSPDGKWVAVAMQGSIWKIDPEMGSAVEIAYNGKYLSSLDWSPDGKWIVYTADDDAKRIQLEILNVETGESHALTDDHEIYLDPVFSPNGRRLAFVSTQPNGYFNIYMRAIRDGQWDSNLVPVTSDHQYPRDRLYFGPWDMHTQPAWTPDGKELVFVSNRNVPLGSGDLWRAPAKANGILEGTLILHEQTLYRTRPCVSIDGKRIVYSSSAGAADQFNHLYVIPIAGGAPYKLTFGSFDDFQPRWSPDGEWIAYISNEGGLPQLCLLETYGGTRKKIPIKRRRWQRAMGRLHVLILDAKTGKPTAARVQGLATDGKFYAPEDTYARIGRSGKHCFYTRGDFAVEVPPGRMRIDAIKGFEYLPATQEVEIRPNQVTSVTLTLHRTVDFPARGWYSGSTHVHMNYGGNLHNTPENLVTMADAEDLHILDALAANKDNRVFDWQYFVLGAREYPLSKPHPGVRIIFGEEYRPPFYGHAFLVGLQDHLISPFVTGYEGTAVESLYPSNTDIFRKAKAQGAITAYVHPFYQADPIASGLVGAKGFPVDAALGVLDALERSDAMREQLPVWHRVLNNDLPIVPVGGEDSLNDMQYGKLLGLVRTYAYLGTNPGIKAWLEAIQKGNTFFSTGPLLDFRINDQAPGSILRLPPAGGKITIKGTVWSVAPLSKVTLYHKGGVLKEVPIVGNPKRVSFEEQVRVTASDWFSLAAEGPPDALFDAEYALAATNTVRVYVGAQKIRDRESAEYFIRWIDMLQAQTEEWPWWRSEAEKKHVLAQYEEARKIYEQFAAETR